MVRWLTSRFADAISEVNRNDSTFAFTETQLIPDLPLHSSRALTSYKANKQWA
jgi:hypothetical protein